MVPDWIINKADHVHSPEAMRLLVAAAVSTTVVPFVTVAM